jgi:hypothetical protein
MSLVGRIAYALKGLYVKEYYQDTSEINITTTDNNQDHKNELGVQFGISRGVFILNYGDHPATFTRPNGKEFKIQPGTGIPFPFEGFADFQVKSTNSGEHTELYIVTWL